MRNRSARIGAALALTTLFAAWGARADDTVFLKKGTPVHGKVLEEGPKGVRMKLADGTVKTLPAASVDHVEYEPPPAPEPAPAPVVEAAPPPAAEPVAQAPVAPASTASDEYDVKEDPSKRYYFIGLKYQGTIVPQAFMNLFVKGGGTVWTNAVTLQADLRKDGFSLMPGITYASYSTGDLLFLQSNKPANDPGNWSLINSGIKVLYLDVDLLWSARLAKNFDFEFGAGFGVGFVFGNLENNWVTPAAANAPGALPGSNAVSGWQGIGGQTSFVACKTQGSGPGCALGDHSGATTAKVGNYQEPSWFNGGSKPNLFPYISFPQIGLRIKPIKSFEGRLGVGFSLTGPWFGFSGYYGLEKLLQKH
jgi:hypothetical protein